MQNRFTIRQVPCNTNIDRLQGYIEDHITWVDRIAFLPSTTITQGDDAAAAGVVAVELNLENYTQKAIAFFEANPTIDLSSSEYDDGSIDSDGEIDKIDGITDIKDITAATATKQESDELLSVCKTNGKEKLPSNRLSDTNGEGGTGAQVWRGGILLANYIRQNAAELFSNRPVVMELGAGCNGLPSMTLARALVTMEQSAAAKSRGMRERRVVVSDSIDEIAFNLHKTVDLLQQQQRQQKQSLLPIEVEQIDFYNIPTQHCSTYDVIMYADCVYSVEQGVALAKACDALRRRTSGAVILSVLPPFRVGISEHIDAMKELMGCNPKEVSGDALLATQELLTEEGNSDASNFDVDMRNIRCNQGGSGAGYRLLKWTISPMCSP